ncbi:MAG TPA: hypothetical protein VD962_10055 [Rubricoccaceae bacterium]|nr:hypothetical protein [Rubricoccaceae bacterium]
MKEENAEGYPMVQDCCRSYRVEEQPDGGVVITIDVDPRFAQLWRVKLSELRATDEEIAYQDRASNPAK